jgi:hypothetical protein
MYLYKKYFPLWSYAAVNVHCIQGGFTKQMLQHASNFFFTLFQLWFVVDTYMMCIILCICHSNHFSAPAKQVPLPADYFATSCKTHNIIHPELHGLLMAALSRRLHNLANQKDQYILHNSFIWQLNHYTF